MATISGDDLRQVDLGGFQLGSGDTLSLKITPQQLAAASATQAGTSGPSGGGLASGQGLQAGQAATAQQFQSQVPVNQRLTKNPQLVTHPLGAQTDAQYESAVAQLQQNINSQYATVLRDLGFLDADGNFVPGALELEAARRRAELGYQQDLAKQQVTNDSLRRGTIFSGRRAVLQAQAEQPYVSALAQLQSGLSSSLGDRYRQAEDLMRQFNVDRDVLIASAAERAANRIIANPVGQAAGTPRPATEYGGNFPELDANTIRTAAALEANPYLFSGGTAAAARPAPAPAARKPTARETYLALRERTGRM